MNHLKSSRYPTQRLHCTVIYAASAGRAFRGPAGLRSVFIPAVAFSGPSQLNQLQLLNPFMTDLSKNHHWAMRAEIRADSTGYHVTLSRTEITLEMKSVRSLLRTRPFFEKELSPTRLFRLKAPLKANYHLPFEGCQIIRQGH